MSIYPTDSRLPSIIISLSPSSSGRAKSRPDMNCELMLPGTLNTPARSCPETFIGRLSAEITAPFSLSALLSADIGRSGSLPWPMNSAFIPSAEATGSRKRRVVPLSPQSRMPPSCSSLRQRKVARVSSEVQSDSEFFLPASATAVISLCACDFDGGASSEPRSLPGVILISIAPSVKENICFRARPGLSYIGCTRRFSSAE